MKNIIIITNGTLPVPATKGGAVENLLNIFLQFNERENDFEILLFSIYDSVAEELSKAYNNTKFIFINDKSRFYIFSRVFRYGLNKLLGHRLHNQFISEVLKYKIKFEAADVILIENNPWYIKHVRKVTSKPIGLHIHNDYLNINNPKSKKIVENSDFIITVSNYIKKQIEEIAPPRLKFMNAYNGIELSRFINGSQKSEVVELKKKHKLNEKDTVIVFSGRFQEHKGIHILIKAFLAISPDLNAKLLLIGGSGFGAVNIELLKKRLNIYDKTDRIILTGFVNYPDIHNYYALGDFAVFPSLCEEGFTLTVLEALASGLPVIITDSGGMPEVINENCGIVIKRDNAITDTLRNEMESLIINKSLIASMAVEARKQARKFSDVEFYKNMVSSINSGIE